LDVLHSMKLVDLLDFKAGGRINIKTSQKWNIGKCCKCGGVSSIVVVDVFAETVDSVVINLSYFCDDCFDE